MTRIVLLFIVVFVALGGVVTVIALIRRSQNARLGLQLARVLAAIYAAGAVIGTTAIVITTFAGRAVHVDLPVAQFWPRLPPGVTVDGVHATVASGGFTVASVEVNGLDLPTRFWLAGEHVLQGATGAVIATVVALLCTNLLRSNPFPSSLVRGINLSAASVIVGGILWQFCGLIGGMLASQQVLAMTGAQWTNPIDLHDLSTITGRPSPDGASWNIDLWPIGIGITLLALSTAFRFGTKLQKDTEGLV